MAPEISNDSEREVWDLSKTFQRPNKRSSWKIAKNLPTSFLYAAKGLRYAFSTQRNFRVHVGFTLVAFILGLFLYNEPFDTYRLFGFILIWVAVIMYLFDLYEKK